MIACCARRVAFGPKRVDRLFCALAIGALMFALPVPALTQGLLDDLTVAVVNDRADVVAMIEPYEMSR